MQTYIFPFILEPSAACIITTEINAIVLILAINMAFVDIWHLIIYFGLLFWHFHCSPKPPIAPTVITERIWKIQ